MKAHAVLWRVIEAVLFAVGEVAIVWEAGVLGDALAKVVHAVEDSGQNVALLDIGLRSQPESALADVAIVDLEEWQELRGRLLLAFPDDRHRAIDLVPLGRQLGELREKWDVGLVEEIHLVPKALDHRFEAGSHIAELDEPTLQPHSLLVRARSDLGSEPQLGRLELGVGRVARIREVGEGRRLPQKRIEA